MTSLGRPFPFLSLNLFWLVWMVGLPNFTYTQSIGEYLGGEEVLYAETKQVNQFFRRFNCEESPLGERYYPGDRLYHDLELRDEYLHMIFDQASQSIDVRTRESFIREMIQKPTFLDFHGGEWLAEVKTSFLWQGRSHEVVLFMRLEETEPGSKWVFSHVYFEPFYQLFEPEALSQAKPQFIHPLSHELDFMNLIRVFQNQAGLEVYASKEYQPDYLTLFLYEIKKGNLSFKSVSQVKFHFFQIDGWYFELSDIQRPGPNRGWLITQLSELGPGNKELLLNYIYRR